MTTPTIVLCGGGSVGHLAPSIAVGQAVHSLMPSARLIFLCANRADEIVVLEHQRLTYRAIPAAAFPRGSLIKWLAFPFVFCQSLLSAWRTLNDLEPAVIFSKGGYVSAPVCIAGWMKKVPIVLHESDSVSGLSNRLVARVAQRVCRGFPTDTSKSTRDIVTGNPVRPEILLGSKSAGQRITGFSGRRPVIMVIGGSQGARAINQAIDAQFDQLIGLADVIHITGGGKAINRAHARYWARPFVTEELAHLYALADIVITRAGAGVLSELAALSKPAIVVPLRGIAQDHQQNNAEILARHDAIVLLPQGELSRLTATIQLLIDDTDRRLRLGAHLHAFFPADASAAIAHAILDAYAVSS